jgi:hypothetical protein
MFFITPELIINGKHLEDKHDIIVANYIGL